MTAPADDPFELQRFLQAQKADYERALRELRAGKKLTHWIWYILPQLRGLGMSQQSTYYGIRSAGEARAYLAHPVLGPRLRECVAAVNAHSGLSAEDMLGQVDAAKFHSCLTLFGAVDGPPSVFAKGLDKYFQGKPDAASLKILSADRGTAA